MSGHVRRDRFIAGAIVLLILATILGTAIYNASHSPPVTPVKPVLADTVRFPVFGYSVEIPEGAAKCAPFDNAVVIYIDGKKVEPNCTFKPNRRWVLISAVRDEEFFDVFAAGQCSALRERWSPFPPPVTGVTQDGTAMPVPSLEMGRRPSEACLYSSNSGGDLFVTTQCGRSPQPPAVAMRCSAWMHTNDSDRDLAKFREIIASVKFFAPEPAAAIPLNHIGATGYCSARPPYIGDLKTYALKDPRSGLTLRLEADKRHIAAFGADGKMVWRRNPFTEKIREPYRTSHPVIARMGVLPNCVARYIQRSQQRDHLIAIEFNSSQFGSLNAQTGDFIFEGQN